MRISDWSSDVCSSDLLDDFCARAGDERAAPDLLHQAVLLHRAEASVLFPAADVDDLRQDLAAVHDLAGHADPIGHAGRDRAALEQRPDDVAVLCEDRHRDLVVRSEEHTSELQSLMRISYAVFCLKKKK